MRLAPGELHLWAWRLDSGLTASKAQINVLSKAELNRMKMLRRATDRELYAICHANVRTTLGAYTGEPAQAVELIHGPHGKPFLKHSCGKIGLQFNLSHTTNLAVLVVCLGHAIGVDIEEVKPVDVSLPQQCFSENEQLELARFSGDAWLRCFYNGWTRKEAILKAEGTGLTGSRLDAFDVTLQPNAPGKLLSYRPEAKLSRHWKLADITLDNNFIGAIASSVIPDSISCYRLL